MAGASPDDGDAAPGRRGGWLLPVLLVVLLGLVSATTVVLVLDRRDATAVEPLRPADVGVGDWQRGSAGQAVVAAQRAASQYFTLDHRRVEQDMDRMRALGTEEFVAGYDDGARALASKVRTGRLSLSARLPQGGVATEYLTSDRAQVLVAVDVTTTAPRRETRRTRYRTRIVLERVEDRWLVDDLDEVR
ncbi:hypothetical protein GCM10023340_20560 [Nocardioides marinquilinus]|uniref:Mce-associated membrane protein n=1 Tax=Nocardioides marinquilinus TaxID=1210400 RepID=A0ABP9PK05_9ACTN